MTFKKTGRITGILILAMTIIAIFSMLYVPDLIVPGDAAATMQKISEAEGLFRLSMISDAFIFLIEIVLVVLLYVLLKPVNKTLALVAAFARLAMTVVQGINLLNHFIVLTLVGGAGYLNVFNPEQLQALAYLFLNVHGSVVLIWGLFFSMHLFALGYLVYKSGYISRIAGIALFIASVCYLIQDFGTILFPGSAELFSIIGFISIIELVFPVWLIMKGVKYEAG